MARAILSSRAIRGSAVRALRPWLRDGVACSRHLSTGRAALAGVAFGDEAVFTQDHVEMREVSVCVGGGGGRLVCMCECVCVRERERERV